MNDIKSPRGQNDDRPPFQRPTPRPAPGPVQPERPIQSEAQQPRSAELPNSPVEATPLPAPSTKAVRPRSLTDEGGSLSVKTPKKSKWVKRLFGVAVALFVTALLLVVGVYVWYSQSLNAVQPVSDEKVKITIDPGTGPEGIAALLKTNDLIRSETAFGWYVRIAGQAGALQAGSYRLGKNEDVPTIVKHLTSGTTDTFSITFLPGGTLAEHRQVLLDAGYSETAVDAALSAEYDSPLFAGKPDSADFEGYIYGETYNFSANATPEEILDYIFEYYAGVVEEQNLVELYKQRGFTLYEGITLASIIQREVATAEDAAQVSQVFQSRLAIDMELGSDVTYQYIADKTGQPRSVDLDSPYNTRRYPGLPPGPIATPGLASLIAVAKPAEGDFLYFLSGDDDKTYFSRTLEGHEKNIRDHCEKKCQII